MPKGVYPRTEWHKARCGFTKGHTINLGKPSSCRGRKCSEKHNKNVSLALMGHEVSQETREKIRKAHIGIRPSVETREKFRQNRLGKPPANKGIPKSEECKQKISATKRRKFIEMMKHLGAPVIESKYSAQWAVVRERVYKRDNGICQECFVKCTRNWDKTRIQCHHVDYDKTRGELSNLITLCLSCHIKTNFRREDWIKYFKTKLLKKEN